MATKNTMYLELILPHVPSEQVPGLFRYIGADCMKRGAQRAIAVAPEGGRPWTVSAEHYQSALRALAEAGCSEDFMLALLASSREVYESLAKVAAKGEQPGPKVRVFLLHHEAVNWLAGADADNPK